MTYNHVTIMLELKKERHGELVHGNVLIQRKVICSNLEEQIRLGGDKSCRSPSPVSYRSLGGQIK